MAYKDMFTILVVDSRIKRTRSPRSTISSACSTATPGSGT
jgi:hypothetical protein